MKSESFLFCHKDRDDYDILLPDIEMRAMDGVQLASHEKLVADESGKFFVTFCCLLSLTDKHTETGGGACGEAGAGQACRLKRGMYPIAI